MTVKPKPIAYPNLIETMKSVVDSHKEIHAAVAEHATDHATAMKNRRQQLSVKRHADRLMKEEGKK